MTVTTMKSFAQSSGKAAGKKEGGFSGKLLGKLADGLEAIEAMAALAAGHVNRFMQLAAQAVHAHTQKLESLKTIPFANPDHGFNETLNPQKAALRNATPKLGLGSGLSSKKHKAKEEDK